MIKIKKGTQTAMVTSGAYKDIFKAQGWEITNTTSSMHKNSDLDLDMKLPDSDQKENTQDENVQEDEDDISEKPLTTLTLSELQELAARYNIDTNNLKTKKELRVAIREAMEEEE